MWTRAELKEKAKAMMKHSYWMMFSVSLVAYLLTDAFADILDMLSEQHLLPLRGGLNLTVNGRSIWLNIPWLQMLQLQNALFFRAHRHHAHGVYRQCDQSGHKSLLSRRCFRSAAVFHIIFRFFFPLPECGEGDVPGQCQDTGLVALAGHPGHRQII